eukprot:2579209-Rhodomonas_salina.1
MHASHAPMAATGWNRTTYNVGKHADIVYNITKLLEFIVPRYIFFLFAFFMVAFALGRGDHQDWPHQGFAVHGCGGGDSAVQQHDEMVSTRSLLSFSHASLANSSWCPHNTG